MTTLSLHHHLRLPEAIQLLMELMAEREHLVGLMKGDWSQPTLEWTLNPSSANPYLLTARFDQDQRITLSINILELDDENVKRSIKQKKIKEKSKEDIPPDLLRTTLENIANDFQSIASKHLFDSEFSKLFDIHPDEWWEKVEKRIYKKYFAIYCDPKTASLINKGILGMAVSACVILFVLAAFMDKSIMTFSTQTALKLGAFYNVSAVLGEWYRLFTGAFFHFGFAHLAYNLIFFLIAGNYVVRRHGVLYFLIFLLAVIPLPFAVEMLFYTDEPLLSGGISSIITSMLGLLIVRQASSYTAGVKLLLTYLVMSIGYILLTGWISNLNLEQGEEKVSNIGHIVGLLAGLFFGLMTNRIASFRTPLRQNLLISSLTASLILTGMTWGCFNSASRGEFYEAMNTIQKTQTASDSLINSVISYNDSSPAQRSMVNLTAAEILEDHLAKMDTILGWRLNHSLKKGILEYRNYVAAEIEYYRTYHQYFKGDDITDQMLEAVTHTRDSLWKVYEESR